MLWKFQVEKLERSSFTIPSSQNMLQRDYARMRVGGGESTSSSLCYIHVDWKLNTVIFIFIWFCDFEICLLLALFIQIFTFYREGGSVWRWFSDQLFTAYWHMQMSLLVLTLSIQYIILLLVSTSVYERFSRSITRKHWVGTIWKNIYSTQLQRP